MSNLDGETVKNDKINVPEIIIIPVTPNTEATTSTTKMNIPKKFHNRYHKRTNLSRTVLQNSIRPTRSTTVKRRLGVPTNSSIANPNIVEHHYDKYNKNHVKIARN